MIRTLWYFLVVAAVAGLAATIAGVPGEIVAQVGETEIAMSVSTALTLFAVAVIAAIVVERAVSFFIHGPGNLAGFWQSRKQMRGYEAFSRGMLAVAAGDGAGAKRHAEKAHALLDKPAMTLLLAAQAAQLNGDRKASAKAFQAMLAAPETQGFALKGLFEQAMAAGETQAAYAHAARALAEAPATPWAFEGRFLIEARRGAYETALETLDAALGQGLVERADARRRRAVLLTAVAQEEARRILEPAGLRDEEESAGADAESIADIRRKALRHALEARDLAPDLVPAAALAARLVAEDGRARRAQKIIEDAWARAGTGSGGPHPVLADVFLDLYPAEAAEVRLKRARALAAKAPSHVESRVMLARAAIAAREWEEARTALDPYAEPFPSRRICLLMAEIAEGDGDMGATRQWLSRSVRAPADAQWVADGYRTAHWMPVVPTTGRFDAFEWRAPTEAMLPSISTSTEEAMAQAAQAVVLPPEVPAPASSAAPARPEAPPEAAGKRAGPVVTSADAAPQVAAPVAQPGPAPALLDIAEEMDGVPRPPDDPGPDWFDEDDDERRPSW